MKKIILVVMFFPVFTSFLSLNAQWAKTYGGNGFDRAYSIQQTIDGGYIVAGETQSFGDGDDFWVIKLFSDGEIEWQKAYGGTIRAYSIQQTIDGGYIVAGDVGPAGILILKLDSDGEIEWKKLYGGIGYEKAYSIQQTIDGGYIVAGETESFGDGSDDFWVIKLFSDGEIEWQKTYGGGASDSASSIQQTIDGGYIVAGETESFGDGSDDFWVIKLFSDGEIEWQKTYGGGASDSASSIQQTSDGGYIVAGETESFGDEWRDIWVFKLSSTGAIEWQRTYGGSSASSIQQTSDGGYIVAGQTRSFGAGRGDVWVLKLSSAGGVEWQRTYGGSLEDEAYSIQQTIDGGYIVAGETESFDPYMTDAWIFKLSSNGELGYSCDLMRSEDATIADTAISGKDTDIELKNTNSTPKETDISLENTSATVNNFCTGKYILCIKDCWNGTTDPLSGIHRYEPSTKVTIKAIPNNVSTFLRWSGDASGSTNPITITIDSHKSILPIFSSTGGWPGFEGCFIATAAYGTSLHPHVKILRDFRDKYIMPSKLGRELVNIYYKYSPFVADFITKHKALKVAVRINLLPLVAFSYSMVHFGPIITSVIMIFIFMLPPFLIAFWRKRITKRLKNYGS